MNYIIQSNNTSETQEIRLNHHDFSVTQNLHAALRRLRLKENCRVLWVDTLCINQSEISERNHQVGFMRDIYQDSEKVLIWLGEPQAPKWSDGVHEIMDAKATRPVSWAMDDQDFAILKDYWSDFRCRPDTLVELDYNFHLFYTIKLLSLSQHLKQIPSINRHLSSSDNPYQDLITSTLESFINMSWWSRLWVSE
jgi:Heterokaryon incompatibility protein (HET)